MKNLISLFAFLFITGCATSPVPYQSAYPVPADKLLAGYSKYSQQKDGSVRVIIVRDSGVLNGIIDFRLSINGIGIAMFSPSERLELFLMPDDYIFAIDAPCWGCLNSIVEREVQVKIGKSYAFRINNQYPNVLSLQPSTLLQ